MPYSKKPCVIIALGGNALSPPEKAVTISEQFSHTRRSLRGLMALLKEDYALAIVHGNGPQVGAALRRVEHSKDILPDVPLGLLVADTEGSIGYMLEQSLQNLLKKENVNREVATLVTQMIVDPDDPALTNPTKYIGRIFTRDEAEVQINQYGLDMKEYAKGQWRRVVGSPKPLKLVNCETFKQMVYSGTITIAAGGGGIPVHVHDDYGYEGVDAVIDKDLAATILGRELNASRLLILTNIDAVYLNFGKKDQKRLSKVKVDELKKYISEGHFQPGSMLPKVEAAIEFVQTGGRETLICGLDHIADALEGKSGTVITN